MRNNETQTSNSSTRSRHRIVNVPDHAMTVFLLIVLGLLLCAFTGAMLSEYLQNAIGKYLGLTNKNEILRFLGIGMGGVLVTMQALTVLQTPPKLWKTPRKPNQTPHGLRHAPPKSRLKLTRTPSAGNVKSG